VMVGGDWPRPEDSQLAHIRQAGTLVLYAEEGEPINISLSNVRVTRYVDTMAFALHAPDLSVISEGNIKVDESQVIETTAPATGTYYLTVTPKQGSAVVRSDSRYLCEVVTAEAPLPLFASDVTRYFYVPSGS